MASTIPLMRPRPTRELRLPAPQDLESLGIPETARELRKRLYQDGVSERWVLDSHCPDGKFMRGREAVWFPRDSNEWYVKVYVPQQRARVQARRKKR